MNKNLFFRSILIISMLFLFANAKELKIIGPLEISGMEPTQSGYMFSRTQVAETLTTVNKKGELIPFLAEKWEVAKEGLFWTFYIKKGIKFHDGTDLDAKVVAFNLNRLHSLNKSVLRDLPIKSIKAKGNKIEIVLNSQFSALPAYFAHYATIILSKNSFNEKNKVIKIIASGAYKVKSITPPLRIKLTRNDNWWKGKANIKNISYLAVPKGETRSLMIKSEEADIAYSMLPISLKSLKRDPNLNTTIVTIPRTRMLKVNSGSEFFNTVNLRKAISLAINREGIAKAILDNKSLAATQIFPKWMKDWHNLNLKPLTTDIKQSKVLLENAGWKLEKDGFRYKNGKKFEITLNTYPNWPDLPIIATAIQSQLKEVGIDLKVLIGSYTEIIRKHQDNSLHLGLITRNFSLVPNPLGTLLQDYSKGGANWGAMNWTNKTMFKYLDELKKAPNPKLLYKITEILQNELPSIPITWSQLAAISNKKVKNFKVDPFEINYFLSDIKWHK